MSGSIKATSAIPWLPTTSEQDIDAPSLAEQVALMLHAERQVIILITGSDGGRVSGFLAELTHAVSHADTVLRIKAAIEAQELFILLANQLHLPVQGLTPMQLATKVGDRLREKAPNGNFVLLCESAQDYSNELLEGIRQLSNYPINIAFCGRPKLLRRLWRPALSALKQRFNYRLDLNEKKLTRSFILLMALFGISVVLLIAQNWIPGPPDALTEAIPPLAAKTAPPAVHNAIEDAPSPIVSTPNVTSTEPASDVYDTPPPAPATPAQAPGTGLSLIFEPTLKHLPKH